MRRTELEDRTTSSDRIGGPNNIVESGIPEKRQTAELYMRNSAGTVAQNSVFVLVTKTDSYIDRDGLCGKLEHQQ